MNTTLSSSTQAYPASYPTAVAAPVQHKHFQRGELITVESTLRHQPYTVLAGEVVILRQGRPVDLIEPGEWLDGWIGADAIAWRDTVLAPVH